MRLYLEKLNNIIINLYKYINIYISSYLGIEDGFDDEVYENEQVRIKSLIYHLEFEEEITRLKKEISILKKIDDKVY
jgi:hypothetical protein